MVDTSHIHVGALIAESHPMKGTRAWMYGACPKCGGGPKSDRFYVKVGKNYFSCRQCGFSGGPLDWVAWRDGYDLSTADGFRAACRRLSVRLDTLDFRPREPKPPPPATTELPVSLGTWNENAAVFQADYQRNAADFCGASFDALRGAEGAKAFMWLLDRGITPAIMDSFGIGYNPSDKRLVWSDVLDKPVWLPRGIVIPWEHGGPDKYHRVNIRRPVGNPKYISAAGWVNSLYNAGRVKPGCNVVMVEGEFDVLLLHTFNEFMVRHNLVAVATGTVKGSRVARWVSLLATAERVFTAFDREYVGYEAHLWWVRALPAGKVVRLRPTHHDVTDIWQDGGDIAVKRWLYDKIVRVAA